MTLSRIEPNPSVPIVNPSEVKKKFTAVNLADTNGPTFAQALVKTVALVFASVIVLLSSPILKAVGCPPTAVLKNIGKCISGIWCRYSQRKNLIAFLKNPSQTQISAEQRQMLIDIAQNSETLKKQMGNLPKDQQELLKACFNSKIPLFVIPKALDCKDPKEMENETFSFTFGLLNKEHTKGQIKEEIEGNSQNELENWTLRSENGLKATHQVPKMFAKDIDRFTMTRTLIKQGQREEILLEGAFKSFTDSHEGSDLSDAELVKNRQAHLLSLLLSSMSTLSSMKGSEQIDRNILASLSQNGAYVNFEKFCEMGLGLSLLNDKIKFPKTELHTEIHDISENELHIVYKGKLSIASQKDNVVTNFGTLDYQITLVWKKEGDQWVDVSYGSAPTDGKVLRFEDHPALFTA